MDQIREALAPWDELNQRLAANVHPPDWVNPTPADRYNLVVIGAGTAGLVTAAGAAALGAKVALVERHLMGGDCLNVGCVPSKALIRSARAARNARDATRFGVSVPGPVTVDFAGVMRRVREIRARISPHDSARRFSELGVDVFLGKGRFIDAQTLGVGDVRLSFAKAVIATGARPAVPDIPGLAGAGFRTNETVFNLADRPRRLAVIGGGPIGCELAQAFALLGSQVTLLHHHGHVLDREDTDAAALVQAELQRDGVQLLLNAGLQQVARTDAGRTLWYAVDGKTGAIEVDEILVGAGRTPNVEELNLDAVGVCFDRQRGVEVDDFLQTTHRNVFACGDVCLRWKFTHAADFAARIVIQNALFAVGGLGRKRFSSLTLPWCTYTDPEIARVGLSEHEAAERGIAVDVWKQDFSQVDRAITDGEESGFVKILTARGGGRIVGATIVARHAGDLISEISTAMAGGVTLGRLAGVIHPYPTQAEAIRKCGDQFNRARLTPRLRRLLAKWLAWRR